MLFPTKIEPYHYNLTQTVFSLRSFNKYRGNNNINGQARGRAMNRGQRNNNQGGQQQPRRGRSRTRRANRGNSSQRK